MKGEQVVHKQWDKMMILESKVAASYTRENK
jgi:hypothetical protein